MNVELITQLGLRGRRSRQRPVWLDMGSVGATSAWAGSYHVLAMGRHYDEYVITGRTIALTPIVGIPAAHPYQRLTGKIRASGVTGNIGEAIAALFVRRYLDAEIGDIAHIKPRRPFQRRKSPDYLMRLKRLLPGVFQDILPVGTEFEWPEWWPVESKARSTEAGTKSGRREALKQLAVYWSVLTNSQPNVIGYGQIVSFTYQPLREVRASLILPKDQPRLIEELRANGDKLEETTLRRCLHEC